MFELTPIAEFDAISPEEEAIVHFVLKIKSDSLTQSVQRRPLKLVVAIDRSGSMRGQKLRDVKKAAAHLIDRLHPEDEITLLSYDHAVKCLCARIPGSEKHLLKRKLEGIQARGMTNLSVAWLTGLRHLLAGQSEDHLHRVLLLTDGLANEGVTDRQTLIEIGGNYRRRGVSTSTLGVGFGFEEDLLTALAEESGGNFYYIERPEQASKAFMDELGEMESVLGQDLEVVVMCEKGVLIEQNYSSFPGRQAPNAVHWKLGDLHADDTRKVVFSLKIPKNFARGYKSVAQVHLRVQSVFEKRERRTQQSLAITFDPRMAARSRPNSEALREVLLMKLAQAQQFATAYADKGDYEGAQKVLTQASLYVRAVLVQNPELPPDDAEFLRSESYSTEGLSERLLNENHYPFNGRKSMIAQLYRIRNQKGIYKKV